MFFAELEQPKELADHSTVLTEYVNLSIQTSKSQYLLDSAVDKSFVGVETALAWLEQS
ncbi:hypothetical protein D9M73_274320 [compost metagenome]